MDRHIENPDTGERVTVTGDGFQTYSNEELGRVFKDYGDGRLYEYDDNGKLMETVWTWVTDNPRHTPGPWTLCETTNADDAGEFEVDAPDYETVALVYASENLVANAALIAAAPDMYEALEACASMLSEIADTPGAWMNEGGTLATIKAAQAALARAEGK